MNEVAILKGYRPLCFFYESGNDYLLCSKGYCLYRVDCNSLVATYLEKFDQGVLDTFKSKFRFVRRILRLGFSSAVKLDAHLFLLSDSKSFYLYDKKTNKLSILDNKALITPPLTLNVSNQASFLYYGEYVKVGSDDIPCVYGVTKEGDIFEIFRFPKGAIDHIHYVYYLRNKHKLLILTGDFSSEIGIWAYSFATNELAPIFQKGQSSRFCWMHMRGSRIVTATDSQIEVNYQKSLFITGDSSEVTSVEDHAKICGSSIYSCEKQDEIFYSTAIEPGPPSGNLIKDLLEVKLGSGIKDNFSRIYSFDWHKLDYGKVVIQAKKDFMPPRLGQFGTFFFPGGVNDTKYLFCYGMAVKKYHDCLVRIDRENL